MGRLDGKISLISGAGPGFGETVAERFAKEGSKIIAVDTKEDNAKGTAEKVKALGGEAVYAVADIADLEQVKKAVEIAVDAFGTIDILFNNAGLQGFAYWAHILDIDLVNAHRAIDVNYRGTWNFIYAVAPIMKENGGGSIVSMASVTGVKDGGNTYGATKGGVISITRGVAGELGEYNIRVNSVSPYTSPTPLIADVLNEEMVKVFEKDALLRRMVDINDVASAVLYLASDESKAITGFDLRVDCGACLRQPVSEEDVLKSNPY